MYQNNNSGGRSQSGYGGGNGNRNGGGFGGGNRNFGDSHKSSNASTAITPQVTTIDLLISKKPFIKSKCINTLSSNNSSSKSPPMSITNTVPKFH